MPDINSIRKIVEMQPNDPFPRYGLAMELSRSGQEAEAHAEFQEMERRFPDYVPQYLMHANLLLKMKRKADAEEACRRGIEAARRKGDAHAQGELQRALDDMEYVED